MDKEEYSQKTNSYIIDFIKFGDAKAGSILTLAGLIAGGVASQAEPAIVNAYKLCPFAGVFVGLVVLAMLYFMINVVIATLAALKPRVYPCDLKSFNSFPDIAAKTEKDYRDAIRLMDVKEVSDHFASHNWVNSKIALDKFKDIAVAIDNLKWVIWTSTLFIVSNISVKILTNFTGG